jgi:hypothetical protein
LLEEAEVTSELSHGSSDEADWIPESSYLQRKLRNEKATADVVYELRSRRVGRSGQESDVDKDRVETSEQAGNILVQHSTLTDENINRSTHSYNLRTRNY